MKIKPLLAGIAVSLALPLAGASAGPTNDHGYGPAGAGPKVAPAHAASSTQSHGRSQHNDRKGSNHHKGGKNGKGGKGSKGSKGGKGSKGSKSRCKP